MKGLPRYLRDRISASTTMKKLLGPIGMTDAEARRLAVDEVAKETKIKPSTLRKSVPPTPPKNTRRGAGLYTLEDARFVYDQLMRDPLSVFKRKPSPSTSSSPVTTGGHQNVRRVRRSKPSPPPEEPPAPPRRDLLYAVGLTGGIGVRSGAININHEFSDSPATQTWRQQNGRV
jgi:hypothetical protein